MPHYRHCLFDELSKFPQQSQQWRLKSVRGVGVCQVCHASYAAMFSFFFGSSTDGPSPPRIREGHKTVEVIIDDERLQVDVDVLAEVSGLFLQIQ